MSVIAQTEIRKALFNTLTAAGNVSQAFKDVDKVKPAADGVVSTFRELSRYEVLAECFVQSEVDRLQSVVSDLDEAIRSETLVWFVYDDCDLDGAHEVSARSVLGKKLVELRDAVLHLADQLSVVVKLQATEKLATSLT